MSQVRPLMFDRFSSPNVQLTLIRLAVFLKTPMFCGQWAVFAFLGLILGVGQLHDPAVGKSNWEFNTPPH